MSIADELKAKFFGPFPEDREPTPGEVNADPERDPEPPAAVDHGQPSKTVDTSHRPMAVDYSQGHGSGPGPSHGSPVRELERLFHSDGVEVEHDYRGTL